MRLILFVILNEVKNLLEEYFTTEFTENTERKVISMIKTDYCLLITVY